MPYTTANPPISAAKASAPSSGQVRIATPAGPETNPTASSSAGLRRSRRCRTALKISMRPLTSAQAPITIARASAVDPGPDQGHETSGEREQAAA